MVKKVAVVTGAGQGLGEAIARRLAADGFWVVIAEYNGEQAQRVASAIEKAGGKALPFRTDVSSGESVRTLVIGS